MVKNEKHFCITFAGPVGSSKSPIAYYLSCIFDLPIFCNDTIRTEVAEDLLKFDQQEYESRRNSRSEALFKRRISLVYDASVDRNWKEFESKLHNFGYACFVISMDLSKEFLLKLCELKGYNETLKRVDLLIADHTNFLRSYKERVGVSINDANFVYRLTICEQAVSNWLTLLH